MVCLLLKFINILWILLFTPHKAKRFFLKKKKKKDDTQNVTILWRISSLCYYFLAVILIE
jgi:putative copper export protein